MEKKKTTPTAYQVLKDTFERLKQKHSDVLFMFRKGDYYELFFADAENIAPVIGLSYQRMKLQDGENFAKVSYLSFPHYALDVYLPKTIRAGYRVCICDPIEIQDGQILEEIIPGLKKAL